MSLLDIQNVTVAYGGNKAVDNVGFQVAEGSLTGLIGPNGAGKTTLFNTISGILRGDSGKIYFKDEDITDLSTHKRARRGIGRTFQRLELFSSLSVFDNIRVAGEIAGMTRSSGKKAQEIIELVELTQIASKEVSEIPTGQARIVELARALMIEPGLLLLDEPASGQTEAETKQFGNLLKNLQKKGFTMLLVEHDMTLVMDVCDTIHVLDFGCLIASGSPSQIRGNQQVLSAYLGEDIDS